MDDWTGYRKKLTICGRWPNTLGGEAISPILVLLAHFFIVYKGLFFQRGEGVVVYLDPDFVAHFLYKDLFQSLDSCHKQTNSIAIY